MLDHQGSEPQRSGRQRARWIAWLAATPVIVLGLYAGAYISLRDWRQTAADTRTVVFPTGGDLAEAVFAPAIRAEEALDPLLREDAEEVLKQALKRAQAEHKRVLMVVGTPGCLPCRQLDVLFGEIGPALTRHFVVAKIDLETMRNGDSVHMRYREEDGRPGNYIPWMVILDHTGTSLVTSDGPDQAVALPQGSDKSRAWFLQMLRQTAPGMTEADLGEIDRSAKAFHDRIWANNG